MDHGVCNLAPQDSTHQQVYDVLNRFDICVRSSQHKSYAAPSRNPHDFRIHNQHHRNHPRLKFLHWRIGVKCPVPSHHGVSATHQRTSPCATKNENYCRQRSSVEHAQMYHCFDAKKSPCGASTKVRSIRKWNCGRDDSSPFSHPLGKLHEVSKEVIRGTYCGKSISAVAPAIRRSQEHLKTPHPAVNEVECEMRPLEVNPSSQLQTLGATGNQLNMESTAESRQPTDSLV